MKKIRVNLWNQWRYFFVETICVNSWNQWQPYLKKKSLTIRESWQYF